MGFRSSLKSLGRMFRRAAKTLGRSMKNALRLGPKTEFKKINQPHHAYLTNKMNEKIRATGAIDGLEDLTFDFGTYKGRPMAVVHERAFEGFNADAKSNVNRNLHQFYTESLAELDRDLKIDEHRKKLMKKGTPKAKATKKSAKSKPQKAVGTKHSTIPTRKKRPRKSLRLSGGSNV